MKTKLIITITLLIISFFVKAQTTNINDTNFEQQLVDLGIDTNGLNGNILNSDAQSVTNLTITVNTITDFTGLEAFVNLITLNLGKNQFATAPLSSLTVLEELIFEDNDALNSLDLSQNTALKKLDIGSKFSGATPHPPISSLNLSTNILLEDITLFYFVNLTNLNLPVTNTLKNIYFYHLAVPLINLSLFNGLENFKFRYSEVPFNIIFPNEQNVLKEVYLGGNFQTVDLSHYLALEKLSLYTSINGVENLNLPATTTFERLQIWGHNLTSPISLANVPNIVFLDIRLNQTTPLVIDLTSNTILKDIYLPNNDMTSVDLTNNIALETLDISSNNITSLNLSQNASTKVLNASYNQLPTIDLSQNTLLERLNLSNNLLTNLDITNNHALKTLSITNNLFTGTGLDLSQNTELYYLNTSYNQIESLNILQNPKLTSLIINNNLFSGNDILNQYYQIRQNDNGILGGVIDVSSNQISGTIPDYTSLIHTGGDGSNIWTRNFKLIFNDNNFEFGDFENQHADYVNYLTIFSPAPHVWPVFKEYRYAPQSKVNSIENYSLNAGDNITLYTTVRGTHNHYKWFKNGNEIIQGPDSPQYIISGVNSCDSGVYHCEISSDLVPFENSSPPGTDNKNLLLVRNDITIDVAYTEECVSLISPLNGTNNVVVGSNIIWENNPGACGYYLNIGTTTGGTDILNNFDAGPDTIYNFISDLPNNSSIFVSITPYFKSGNVLSCTEEMFTTGSPNDFISTWKTDNPGVSSNSSITIPTNSNEAYNYDVDWNNDGSFDELGLTGNVTHDFSSAGLYTIGIRGQFPRIFFNNELDKDKILSVNQWGNQVWASMEKAFYGCSNINIIATESPNLSAVSNMSGMFKNAISFNQNIASWNIESLTDATNMFEGVSLSTENYDALLISWQSQIHNNNVVFSGGNSFYCNSETERDALISDGWIITDSGKDCGTGIISNTEIFNIEIYPNPTDNFLYFNFNSNSNSVTYKIYNKLGQKIISGKFIKDAYINVEKLKQGLYIIKFKIDNNILFKKFIKM